MRRLTKYVIQRTYLANNKAYWLNDEGIVSLEFIHQCMWKSAMRTAVIIQLMSMIV